MPVEVEIRLPELADAMASATLTTWLKNPGDPVTAGEPVAEVETDKTTVELESPADGVLGDVRVEAGTEHVAVGTVLAVVRENSGAAKAVRAAEAAPPLVEVRLPELAEAMTAATLTAWLKNPGDPVTAGEPIAEVETDKTTVELESPADGVLADIRVAAGAEGVAVGTVLALVREAAQGAAGIQDRPGTAPPAVDEGTVPPPKAVDPVAGPAVQSAAIVAAGEEAADGSTGPEPETREVSATPLARRMAALAGLDLSRATGSGVGGRVMKVDVERLLRSANVPDAATAAVESRSAGTAAPEAPSPVLPSEVSHTDRPLSAMRRVTARRTAEAKRSAPHFYLEIECAVDRLLARRSADGGSSDAGAGTVTTAPTVNDVVVRAAALALKAVPLANSAWTGDAVRVYDRVDLAVAVSTPAGLVTPVIRSADTKSLSVIAGELRTLAADARAGRLQPADYQGGTCTVSNLGMFGISSLYAILNPPQSCILGIGAIVERPVVRDGTIDVGSMMTVTLSADHRAIDGATGAELLRAFKGLIEDPAQLFA